MTAKQPTPSGVSRLLGKAGHTRAIVAIRNGRPGYWVTEGPAGKVHVEFYANTGFCSVSRRIETLDRYASSVTDAGYSCAHDVDFDRLIVTAPAGEPAPEPRKD